MPEPPVTAPDPSPPDRRSPFEWSLAALRPADAEVARPSFMFKAGQASRDKVVRFWRWVAGGLMVLIVTGGVAGFGLIRAEQQRAAAIAAEAHAVRVQPIHPRVPPPADLDEITPAISTEFVVPTPLSSPRLQRTTPPDRPTAAEIASALERRRNILVGGLGLIPDSPPLPTPELRPGTPTYPGVLAAPRVQKKPTILDPDPDPDLDPDPDPAPDDLR